MTDEEATRVATAVQKLIATGAQLERQVLIKTLEGFIKDYRLHQPNYDDAVHKKEQAFDELVKVLIEVGQ